MYIIVWVKEIQSPEYFPTKKLLMKYNMSYNNKFTENGYLIKSKLIHSRLFQVFLIQFKSTDFLKIIFIGWYYSPFFFYLHNYLKCPIDNGLDILYFYLYLLQYSNILNALKLLQQENVLIFHTNGLEISFSIIFLKKMFNRLRNSCHTIRFIWYH